MRGDVTSQLGRVLITEGEVVGGFHPIVETIEGKQDLMLVTLVELLQELSETTGSQVRLGNSQINNVHE